MTVNELIQTLNLEVVSEGETGSTEIDGCFCGDLLSLAMSGINAGNAWITVQTNVNILGIAALTETSCVIVANDMDISESVSDKAKEENICLLKSKMPAYELCCKFGECI